MAAARGGAEPAGTTPPEKGVVFDRKATPRHHPPFYAFT
jgi:hypothetical protein